MYWMYGRNAFSHGMDRVTMSLDGTDCANGKVMACVVGAADRDLHGWQIADPNFIVVFCFWCFNFMVIFGAVLKFQCDMWCLS